MLLSASIVNVFILCGSFGPVQPGTPHGSLFFPRQASDFSVQAALSIGNAARIAPYGLVNQRFGVRSSSDCGSRRTCQVRSVLPGLESRSLGSKDWCYRTAPAPIQARCTGTPIVP